MTASDWLTQHFGPADEFCPMPAYTASRHFFLEVFGPALEKALVAGTSTYDALMGIEGGAHGWNIYFDDWKQRGILR